ncbi:hypothetical protein C7445_101137 [Alicyclobacillus sacchari]|uniref:Uncharacterized protein n=1 Tax=Alicyclobacillus sacchari TaxID=392010 RepID=A0A4R8LVI0_9BACL|nr:hypothetical protein [Alicyclobacillus sacchari]TDY51142.1 hypothetical protein C7445_101137 [Alicyclobacillus sacchari]
MVTFMLGLIAGLIGVIETLLDMLSKQGYTPDFSWRGYGAIAISIIAMALSVLSRTRPRAAGIGMYACAVIGFVFASFSYIPPGIVLIIAGTIATFFDMNGRQTAD